MNTFLTYDYFLQKYPGLVEVPVSEVDWPALFEYAKKSIFICGGELRKGDDPEEAKKCVEVARQKHVENPDFRVSIMCGQWLYAGTTPPDNESHVINNIIRGFHALSQDDPSWIRLYYNYLNVIESTESGYFHSIVVDEDDLERRIAYVERPHGISSEDAIYAMRKWVYSSESDFVHDIVQIRESFCKRFGIVAQSFETAYPKLIERTLSKNDFDRESIGWGFMTHEQFDECRKKWSSGTLPCSRLTVEPYYEPIAISGL